MKIFNNFYTHQYIKNTDWRYPKNFQFFSEKDIHVIPNDSKISVLYAHAIYLFFSLLSRLKIDSRRIQLFNDLRQSYFIPRSYVKELDVILSHGHMPIFASQLNKPIVYCGGFMTNEYAGTASIAERKIPIQTNKTFIDASTYTIFNTQDAVDRYIAIEPSVKHKLHYLPFYLPYLKSVTSEYVKKKQSEKSIKILFVGNDGKRKGLHNLIKAINLLAQKEFIRLCHFVFITEDALEGIDKNISYDHRQGLTQSDVKSLMEKSHIFILPTLKDSYGLVFIEAMSSGCAIISDNQQPRIEILDDGKCGVMVEPTNYNDIAMRLEELIVCADKRTDLALQGLNRFNSEFHPKIVKEKYLRLLKKAFQDYA